MSGTAKRRDMRGSPASDIFISPRQGKTTRRRSGQTGVVGPGTVCPRAPATYRGHVS